MKRQQVEMYFAFWSTIFLSLFGGVISEDEWMQLEYIGGTSRCLTGGYRWIYVVRCNGNMRENQLWRWGENGGLKHKETGSCAIVLDKTTLQLGSCENPEQQLSCLPYALKTKTGSYLSALNGFLHFGSIIKGRWRRFGDSSGNICNTTDLKWFWDLKSSNLSWKGHNQSRNLVGKSPRIIVLPVNATATLGDFRGTCISDPETCSNGLSFEIWLWLVDYDLQNSSARSIILQSGSIASRGFQLSLTRSDLTFSVYTTNYSSKCQVSIPRFNHWVHIVGLWDRRSMVAQLIADNVSYGCVTIWPRNTSQTEHLEGDLKLGPLAKIGEGFVVAQNLSIWVRVLTDMEREELFKYPTPKVPNIWSDWSTCTSQCRQERRLECHNDECDVVVIESRRCYDECGRGYVEMNVVIRFVDERWSEELTSNATDSLLAGKIKRNIQEVYRGDGTYISATIKSFRQGSVIADIIFAFSNLVGTQVTRLLHDLDGGFLNGRMPVSYNYSDFAILNSSVPNDWPHIEELYNTSSTSFNVSWSPLNNMSYVQGFKIYFTSLTQWNVVNVSKHVFHAEIKGLEILTTYMVSVGAYSMEGDGLPSPIRNVTTDEWIPKVGPPGLTAYWNKSDYTVHVTWSQIPQPFIRGYLTHYVIKYSNSTHNFTKTSRTTSSVLTGLLRFSEYTVEVVGATRIGPGRNSSKISYRTRGLPVPAPKNLTATNITASTINVSWTAIPDHPKFDEVVGYRMYYYDQSEMKNLSLPVSQTRVTIHNVKWNVNYDITVSGLTIDNQEGRRAITSTFLKNITVPKWPPANLSCPGVTPYTVSVGWRAYTADETGGSLEGYILSYNVKGDPSKLMNITLDPYPPWTTLENLKTFTEYEIRVLVYNEKGVSPLANITCKTGVGVPRETPQNLQAHSYVGETFISLSWQHVLVNGTRRGYKLLYQKVSDAGSEIKDSKIEAMMFSEDTTQATVHGLDLYSKYCFQILVFNENFYSKPGNSVCAETCRCPRRFYTNWFIQDPYVVTSSSGIFPPLVKRMIAGVCGPCKAHGDRVIVDFKMDGNNETARKNTSNMVQLEKTTDATQVSFPVVGPKTGVTGRSGAFIPIIDSPMSAFITRKPSIHTKAQLAIEQSLVRTLPLLALTVVLLFLGAILIWAVEYKSDAKTFPRPFHRGIQQGFWWAYVSVTTVGYGDKIPTSIAGRLFSVVVILYGTVLTGLITVSLTAALTVTVVVVSTDVKLYGSHVAAIEHSPDVQLGLLRSAYVNEGKNFTDVNSVLKAVENGDVDGALVDKLTAARLDVLSDPSSTLVVKDVIPKLSTYGIFLTGDAIKLHKKFRQYLQNNAEFVTGQIENYTQPLKKGAVSQQKEEDTEQKDETNIISASSPVFLPLFLWLLAVLIFVVTVGVVWHFLYYKHVAQAAKKNQVCAINESKTTATSLQQFTKDFHKETCKKLQDMKSRHIKELRALHKLKTSQTQTI